MILSIKRLIYLQLAQTIETKVVVDSRYLIKTKHVYIKISPIYILNTESGPNLQDKTISDGHPS